MSELEQLRSSNTLFGGFVVSLTLIGFPLVALGHLKYSDSELGNFTFFEKFLALPPNGIGDTLAGIFGSLAFLAAITAVILQSVELAAQRREMSRQADESAIRNIALRQQSIENSIFEMLRTHIQVVNGLDLLSKDEKKVVATGRDCFVSFYSTMSRAYRDRKKKHPEPVARYYAYKDMWNDHGGDLGHYFRFLYNSFKFISETDEEMRYKYGRIFRAQLSDAELQLLFYNCLSDNGKPFIKYAKSFQIFDNLPTLKLLDNSHVDLLPEEVFGDNKMITASQLKAREQFIISELTAGRVP